MFEQVRGGVVQIRTLTCDGEATGSGFLIKGGTVATVAHVVNNEVALAVRGDHGTWRGEVIGIDRSAEVALVRPVNKLNGHQFDFSGKALRVGEGLNALGYPQGLPLAMLDGKVTSLEQQITVTGNAVERVMSLNADTTAGMSGGPVIDEWGRVIGLVEASKNQRWTTSDGLSSVDVGVPGMNYAVPMESVRDRIENWRAHPASVPSGRCSIETGVVKVTSVHADAPFLAHRLGWYYSAVNAGAYEQAWSLLGSSLHKSYGDESAFEGEMADLTVVRADLKKADFIDESTDVAHVDVVTATRDESAGTSCATTSVDITFDLSTGWWLISNERQVTSPVSIPCPASATS